MFSVVRKISLLCIILSAINIVVGILLLIFILNAKLSFAEEFCALIYLVTSSGILLALGCGFRSACLDFELETETYAERIVDLRKRVESLESRF